MKNEVNYYAQLVELIKVQKNPAANLLKNKKQDKKDLVQWIYKQTEFLNSEKITFSTRIFYIINNIKTLPTCALDTCNKTLHNLNFSITADKTTFYTHHCCRAHIQLDKNVRAKIENTMFFYFLSEDYIANTLNKEFTPYILSGVTKESNNFLTKIKNYRTNNNNSQVKYYSLMT